MGKRNRSASLDAAVVDVLHREVGQLSGRRFSHRFAASKDLVLRLELYKKLNKHSGCVNTVSFNAYGNILVSGSDDRQVILWDWETGNIKLAFESGHQGNVFQAKFMGFSDDRSIVTCAADGEVRHSQIHEDGEVATEMVTKHQGRAHNLAVEPGSSHGFYSCGEDGLVQHIDLRTRSATELFTCGHPEDRAAYMSKVHLNAITIDPRNPNLFAVAGSDEFARLYDIRRYKWDASTDFGPADYFCPPHLIGDKQVGITGLAFSDRSELLATYNDELIYLFTRDMGLGPNPRGKTSTDDDVEKAPQVYKGHRNCETVKGVNFFGPKCEYVVSGSDCGRIFVWSREGGELIHVMEGDRHVVNCIEPHPHSTVLASSGIERDIKIFTPKAIKKATLPANIEQVRMHSLIRWFDIADDDDDDDDEDDNDNTDDDDDEYFCDDDDFYCEDNDENEDDDVDDEDEDDVDNDVDHEDDGNKDVDDLLNRCDDDGTNSDSHFVSSAEAKGQEEQDGPDSFPSRSDVGAVFPIRSSPKK